jgi:hypothetical protein
VVIQLDHYSQPGGAGGSPNLPPPHRGCCFSHLDGRAPAKIPHGNAWETVRGIEGGAKDGPSKDLRRFEDEGSFLEEIRVSGGWGHQKSNKPAKQKGATVAAGWGVERGWGMDNWSTPTDVYNDFWPGKSILCSICSLEKCCT